MSAKQSRAIKDAVQFLRDYAGDWKPELPNEFALSLMFQLGRIEGIALDLDAIYEEEEEDND